MSSGPSRREPIKIRVDGEPVPKQSFRVGPHPYQPKRLTDWQAMVAWSAREAMGARTPVAYPVAVEIWFFRKRKGRCDLDNLSKAVLDAMNGIVYGDDDQVVDLVLHKRFCDLPHHVPGITVVVREGE